MNQQREKTCSGEKNFFQVKFGFFSKNPGQPSLDTNLVLNSDV